MGFGGFEHIVGFMVSIFDFRVRVSFKLEVCVLSSGLKRRNFDYANSLLNLVITETT